MNQDEKLKEKRFLMQILRNTQNDIIKWEKKSIESYNLSTGEHKFGSEFQTKLNERIMVIYNVESKYSMKIIVSSPEWVKEIRLGFIDPKGKLAYWEFSSLEYSIIRDIYNEIVRKESHIDDFINQILGTNV